MEKQQKEKQQCSVCKHTFHRLLVCGRCGLVSYCSKQCQKQAWPTHKQWCVNRKLGEAKPKNDSFDCLIKQKYEYLKSQGKEDEAEAFKAKMDANSLALSMMEDIKASNDEKEKLDLLVRAFGFYATEYQKHDF